jgi:hypothetical protein
MGRIFEHYQEKTEKKYNNFSTCNLNLDVDDNELTYHASFHSDYTSFNKKRNITFVHSFTLNLNSGDINVTYKIVNHNVTEDKMFRNLCHKQKNNFNQLVTLTESGFMYGEKKFKYWGVKYIRATEKLFDLVQEKLSEKFTSNIYKDKNYKDKYCINPLYDLIIDFHMDKKQIKPHDLIYWDVQYNYPKKKWLKKNDNKYIPAMLDEYGIKSKYIISKLSNSENSKQRPFFINSLNYICRMFGDNYIDYLKKINWLEHCFNSVPNKKIHVLKTDAEKKCMVDTINKWDKDFINDECLVYSTNKLLSIRDFLESKNINLKYTAKNDYDFQNLLIRWTSIKKYHNRGYKLKYSPPDDFVKMIEDEIVINNNVYKPKLLLTEEDFTIEGYEMKNCMSNQFAHGAIYFYVSLQHKRKKINLQYRHGTLNQSYGKANSPVDPVFQDAILVLSARFMTNPYVKWTKEKYDIID